MSSDLLFHEVAPRDGLQNESKILATEDKLALVRNLVKARPNSIEVTSFVRPDRVPQLADADELCTRLADEAWRGEAPLFGLVPNQRGFARFLQAGLEGVTLTFSATEGHALANLGMSKQSATATAANLAGQARSHQLQSRAYLSMAFGCPVEGEVDVHSVRGQCAELVDAGADVVLLGDTLGCAEELQVERVLQEVLGVVPVEQLGLHFHDTGGRALANALMGWQAGVRHFDGSVSGCGGCPFAPGAAGNVDSLLLLPFLQTNGAQVGQDLDALEMAGIFLQSTLKQAPGLPSG